MNESARPQLPIARLRIRLIYSNFDPWATARTGVAVLPAEAEATSQSIMEMPRDGDTIHFAHYRRTTPTIAALSVRQRAPKPQGF
jgi:hypothetical protein